jgi:hypothetical protein
MKKIIFLVLIFFLYSNVSALAAEPTMLKEATVKVKAGNDKNYAISEKVSLSHAGSIKEKISHTFSNLESSQIDQLTVTSNGQELEYHWEKGDALNKLLVTPPENVSDDFTYELQYSLTLQEDSYITPLFVPEYPTQGNSNIVQISFNAPEGETVHKNSFPVIIDEVNNEVESHIMNIPSHVKYVYGEDAGPFNVFNVTSWVVVLALITIIFTWFRAEVNKKKGAAA